MVVRNPQVGDVTFDEFVDLVPDGQKADLIHGVIYMASPENIEHNNLVTWLDRVVGTVVEELKLGTLTVNRVAYRLGEHESPEPDVAVVLSHRLHLLKRGHVDGPPDLVIEIVSPDSVHRDYEDKREQYEAAGVKEYWILDQRTRTPTFLVLDGGKFVEVPVPDHIYRSRVLPGLWLDVRWLWERPPTRATVDRILRGESPAGV